ncbi:MAG: sensor histidine kinase [Clostridiales bacterium]|nr:sensor histidine kinase [Clostridiales bacterium]
MTRVKKPRRQSSIGRYIVAAFMLLILLVTLGMMLVSISTSSRELQANAMDYTEQLVLRVNADIDLYVQYIKDISDFLVDNTAIISYLQAARSGELSSRVEDEATGQLAAAISIRSEFSAIALASPSGDVIFGSPDAERNVNSDYMRADWYLDAVANPREVQVSSSRVENLIADRYTWVVSFSKAVTNAYGEVLGVLLIDLNYNIIDSICAAIELGSRGYIFLLGSDGEILWHPQQDLIYAGLKSENVADIMAAGPGRLSSGAGSAAKQYVICPSEDTGWTAVGVVYTEELLQMQGAMIRSYAAIGACALTVALVIAFLLSKSITQPIHALQHTMHQVEQGDLNVRCGVTAGNELGQLSDSFNHMIATTQALMDETARVAEQKRISEWRALQAQIQPHFLYNTLDSIIWMSHAGRNAEVVEMTSALASLLRRSIGTGSDTNTLAEELDHVKSYLTIQKMRYNEKLQYELDMDPQTADCLLPKLILQPLVENAIYHGIKVKQTGGTVRVESILEEDRLLITVEDDGVGMTEEQIARIFEKKQSDAESTKIGVYNVNERLQYYFGSEASMRYYSTPGRRTMVMLVLPIVREKEGHGDEA